MATLNGFNEFVQLYPRDLYRPWKRGNLDDCRRIWLKDRLDERIDDVLSALKEDINGINRGGAAADSNDRYAFFPGMLIWLRQRRWDRPLSQQKPSTSQERRVALDHRAMLRAREMWKLGQVGTMREAVEIITREIIEFNKVNALMQEDLKE